MEVENPVLQVSQQATTIDEFVGQELFPKWFPYAASPSLKPKNMNT